MSAPLAVNTKDGVCWTRREATRGGEALYAPEKCGACPAFVMVTLTELAELGIVGSAAVLPVPVGPEPQVLGRPEGACILCDAVKPDDHALRDHVLNVHPDEFCRIYHGQPCRHEIAAVSLSGPICSQSEAHAAGLDVAPSVEELDGMAESIVHVGDPLSAEVSLAQAVPLLTAAVTGLRAQVAALLEERHSTNEALDDAVQALRARQSCPCPPEGRPHQLGCPQAEAPSPLHRPYRTPHDLPVPDTCRLSADELDEISRDVWSGGGAS